MVVNLLLAFDPLDGGDLRLDLALNAAIAVELQPTFAASPSNEWVSGDLEPVAALLQATDFILRRPAVEGADGTRYQTAILVREPAETGMAATLRAAAHGGQILWSPKAYDAIKNEPTARFYGWTKLSSGFWKKTIAWECEYDNPQNLLEAPFARAFSQEVASWVAPRRTAAAADNDDETLAGRDPVLASPHRPDVRNDLYGIALSGGGMRSAVFSLGVAQALSFHRLLAPADYLSVVSGGSFFGTSFEGLCGEPLPYKGLPKFTGKYETFPYAVPDQYETSPIANPAAATSFDVPVHGIETPALWHVRKHAKLLGSAIGLFSPTTWLTLGRYLLSTLVLLFLFFLPTLVLVTFAGTAAWAQVWDWVDHEPSWVFAPPGAALGILLFLGMLRLLGAPESNWMRWLVALGATLVIATLVGLAAWAIEEHSRVSGLIAAAVSAIGSLSLARGLTNLFKPKPVIGLLTKALIVLGGYVLLGVAAAVTAWGAWTVIEHRPVAAAIIAAVALAVAAFTILFRPLVLLLNHLSLSDMYAARLQKTWSISANPPGGNAPADSVPRWSRVWTANWLTLATLRPDAAGGAGPHVDAPYPLICSTLNVPGSRGEKLPERKGDSFVIAPLVTGSALTRWTATDGLDDFERMPLARASSISGAAVSPNMGQSTTTTISVVATLFNARLGRWVRNPRGGRARWWQSPPLFLYWREMLGMATRSDLFVYLSDGGHFENLGIYELLRRRCKFILAVSADLEDAGKPDSPGNLGTATRLARVDFGVNIEVEPFKPLLRHPKTGYVLSSYAAGRIHYPRLLPPGTPPPGDGDDAAGTLILIKTGLVEDQITPDLLRYWRTNPSFPYDSTEDQQFDQPQFESYRQLGYLAGTAVGTIAGQAGNDLESRFEHVLNEFVSRDWDAATVVEAVNAVAEELSTSE